MEQIFGINYLMQEPQNEINDFQIKVWTKLNELEQKLDQRDEKQHEKWVLLSDMDKLDPKTHVLQTNFAITKIQGFCSITWRIKHYYSQYQFRNVTHVTLVEDLKELRGKRQFPKAAIQIKNL